MSQRLTGPCKDLKEFLEDGKKHKFAFDCVGGCGVDASLGTNNCMSDSGYWFKFCPFCGAPIIKIEENEVWTWWEGESPQQEEKSEKESS